MGKTILTVDDSVSIRQMVSFTLKGGGYEVLQAADGEEAAAAAESLQGQAEALYQSVSRFRVDSDVEPPAGRIAPPALPASVPMRSGVTAPRASVSSPTRSPASLLAVPADADWEAF